MQAKSMEKQVTPIAGLGMKRPMPELAERFVRIEEVSRMVGLSRTSIYSRIQKEEFPKPVPLGGNRVAWLLSELSAYMQTRIDLRDQQAQQEKS